MYPAGFMLWQTALKLGVGIREAGLYLNASTDALMVY